MMRTVLLLTAALTSVLATPASGQTVADVRKLYDAGQYQEVVTTASQAAEDPRITFIMAQSQQRLAHTDEARALYAQLASRGEGDPWRGIGQSALALLSSNPAGAVEAAGQAVASGPLLAEAHFQRGLALSARQDMAGAAAEFERATELDRNWAHAHYYAGLAYSKVKRVDLTASHFQTFLKLAPNAPERLEVQSILRTLGGR